MHATQPQNALCPWRAALYIRLSRDDGDKAESNSVTYQREILREHLKLRPDIAIHDYRCTTHNRMDTAKCTGQTIRIDRLEQENAFLTHFRKYRSLTELVREIRIFEVGRLEITLNFQDEFRSLTDYLNTNRESPEPCAN